MKSLLDKLCSYLGMYIHPVMENSSKLNPVLDRAHDNGRNRYQHQSQCQLVTPIKPPPCSCNTLHSPFPPSGNWCRA